MGVWDLVDKINFAGSINAVSVLWDILFSVYLLSE